MLHSDSLIFDMDGTLWDNVNSYVISWNKGLENRGYQKQVTRDNILGLMGKEARVMLQSIIPDATAHEQDLLFDAVIEEYQLLLADMNPVIYEGVLAGLKQLSEKYPLFLLSNCEEGGLVNFMHHTKTTPLFIDYMEHGMNLMPKHHNLRLLMEKYGLNAPVYIGDTDSDSDQSMMAGVPFVYVSYGFGVTDKYSLKFDSFTALTAYFLNQ
ncbi:MAG: HAD family hydrolase [Bacteroidales bacterium]|jgi:phosphoglycolate phosphatase|nr:HAD family hydrolase [Bacteroidales bacterium]